MKHSEYIIFLFFLLFFTQSCKKPEVPFIFAEKKWELLSITIDPQVTVGNDRTDNLWDLVQTECTEDDSYFFAADHRILIYDNQLMCQTNDYTVRGTWAYGTTDEKIDIVVDEDLHYTADIIEHTETRLVLEVPGIAYGFTGPYIVTEEYKIASTE